MVMVMARRDGVGDGSGTSMATVQQGLGMARRDGVGNESGTVMAMVRQG
jgi:hypothetical protein